MSESLRSVATRVSAIAGAGVLSAAALSIGLLSYGSGAQAQVEPVARVGFVSLDRILRDAAPAQRAQKKIEAEFAKRDQELGRAEQDLKKRQDALEKNSVTLSENDRRNREREFNDTNREFQR
ncbi:MAG: OmpH family outer membrane protein, partial [Burkholderiales bacterium]